MLISREVYEMYRRVIYETVVENRNKTCAVYALKQIVRG